MRGYKTSENIVDQCIKLRRIGWSLGELCNKFNIPKTTIFSYIKPIILSAEQQKRISLNTSIGVIKNNKSRKGISRPNNQVRVNPKLNAELVGCLAHFLFDGTTIGHLACYYNRSNSLVSIQRKLVKKYFGLNGRLYQQDSGVIRIAYHSVELVNIIKNYHSELLQVILNSPKSWQQAFLKSFFDDEGTIDILSRRVSGFQKDVSILILVQKLLNNFTIESTIRHQKNRVSTVEIRKYENLCLFQRFINFSEGLNMNSKRKNSRYTFDIEKRELLKIAIKSFK